MTIRASALVFSDPKSIQLRSLIERVAPSEANILVIGETGTGKELVARQVHISSKRSNQPFLAINCGAFSETLFESELFGFERGSFTGETNTKAGWFEAANNGTLFLDEIGDLPLPMQVKLLRVLQEGEVVRIGARKPIPVDVRLIAATNVDLEEAVAAGRFREDLYYRLKVITLDLPPLKDRPKDILALANHFIEKYTTRLAIAAPRLSPLAEQALEEYYWPGNIRELENTIHRALLVFQGNQILSTDLNLPLAKQGIEPSHSPANNPVSKALSAPQPAALPIYQDDNFEEYLARVFNAGGEEILDRLMSQIITTAYKHERQNQVKTAKLLGISRNVLRTHLKNHGLLE